VTLFQKKSAIVPVPRIGRWFAIFATLLILALLAQSVALNPRFRWDVVASYLFAPEILRGLRVTLELTVCAMAIGTVGGMILAIMRISRSRFLSSVAWIYIWFFRGTPVLVQLLFWFNIQALYPDISIGFGSAFKIDANAIITPMVAAIVGLGLNEAAYMAEITRAGINSIDSGQIHAAQALGMTRSETLRRIVLPQAMRVIIPPTANQAIGLLKTSSIASVIAVTELLYSAQLIYSINYLTMPLLIVASLWYLAITTLLSAIQHRLERRFNRGTHHDTQPA
jgi:polar amino acid transport system permease protein